MGSRLANLIPTGLRRRLPFFSNGSRPLEAKSSRLAFAGPSSSSWRWLYSDIPGDTESVKRETAFAAAVYCYVAVRYRAENIAEAPLRVVEITSRGEQPVVGHELESVLTEPTPDLDMGELLELTQSWVDIGAGALWVKDRDMGGGLARLSPFSFEDFEVAQTRDRVYGKFKVDTASGPKTFSPDEVVYFHSLNPLRRPEGLSPTDVALAWLNIGKRATTAIKAILDNAMMPSVVISVDKEWRPTEEEFDRFTAMLEQYHAGASNSGRPFVNLGGGRVDRLSLGVGDLLPTQLLDRIEACVASVFGIPPVVLSYLAGLKNSPWSQMAEARRYVYEDTIEPLWKRYERRLTRQLLRPLDADPRRQIRFDTSGIRALQDEQSLKVKDAAMARFWTINQRLQHSGQEPLPDGDPRGDFIEAVDPMLGALQGAAQGKEIEAILNGFEGQGGEGDG